MSGEEEEGWCSVGAWERCSEATAQENQEEEEQKKQDEEEQDDAKEEEQEEEQEEEKEEETKQKWAPLEIICTDEFDHHMTNFQRKFIFS